MDQQFVIFMKSSFQNISVSSRGHGNNLSCACAAQICYVYWQHYYIFH